MGIFYNTTKVRNLAPENITVRFDGQDRTVPPGVSDLASAALYFGMNQNPIMGTQDPNNPNVRGAKYLLVEVGSEWDREPLTAEEWATHLGRPCRMDIEHEIESGLGKHEHLIIRGKNKKTAAAGAGDTGVRSRMPDMTTDLTGPEA